LATTERKNLKTRAITGLFFSAVTVLSLLNEISFFLLFAIYALGCLYEYYKLSKSHGNPQVINGLFFGISMYSMNAVYLIEQNSGFFLSFPYYKLAASFIIVFILMSFLTMIFTTARRPFTNLAITFLGIIYVIIPFICFQYFGIKLMKEGDKSYIFNYEIPMGFIFMIWTNDTFAYLTGRILGKNKLAKSISPGKTIEGTLGGTLATIGLAIFLSGVWKTLEVHDWIVMAVVCSILGVLGDLAESKLKRSLNIKNSGKIFPGHGGFLDRFDSLLLSVPVYFIYLMLFKF
jgi:phosphatidate cytidylyltransferase